MRLPIETLVRQWNHYEWWQDRRGRWHAMHRLQSITDPKIVEIDADAGYLRRLGYTVMLDVDPPPGPCWVTLVITEPVGRPRGAANAAD